MLIEREDAGCELFLMLLVLDELRVAAFTRLDETRLLLTVLTLDRFRTVEARLATALSRLAVYRTSGCLELSDILPSLRILAWLRAALDIRRDCSWFRCTTVRALEL